MPKGLPSSELKTRGLPKTFVYFCAGGALNSVGPCSEKGGAASRTAPHGLGLLGPDDLTRGRWAEELRHLGS